MARLILIRHGETDKNIRNNLHDFMDKECLNQKGRQQLKFASQYLKSFAPDIVFSSKEKRAVESAEIVSEHLKIPLQEIEELHERNWGDLSGKSWAEVENVLKPMTLTERYHHIPQNGESWKDFESRLIKAIRCLTKSYPNKNLVVITHGGAIRALMPFLLNVGKEESFKYSFENASLTIFEILSSSQYENKQTNYTEYLPKELR